MISTQNNLFFVYDKMFLYACEHTAVQYANTHTAKKRIKGRQNVCPTQCSTALITTALIKYIYIKKKLKVI